MFDFAQIIQRLTITIPPILLAVTVHEISHGWVAYKLGDPTAKDAGRLTFNPISHLDLFGTLAFLLTQAIGWAKPVPVNPRYFNHPRKDMIWVSLAGPASNILLAIVLAVILKLFFLIPTLGAPAMFFLKPLAYMIQIGVMINIGLAVFNLLPIPPLDGSKIMEGLLPYNLSIQYAKLEPYGFILLLLLIFTNTIDWLIIPIIRFLANLLI
jgi:Zn-dependent protease